MSAQVGRHRRRPALDLALRSGAPLALFFWVLLISSSISLISANSGVSIDLSARRSLSPGLAERNELALAFEDPHGAGSLLGGKRARRRVGG